MALDSVESGSEAAYDVILVFSLVHHFDEATNRQLVSRAARALRPGGYLVIGDALRPSAPGKGGQQAAFLDLYFALTSESGLWSFDDMRDWQVAAGQRRARRSPWCPVAHSRSRLGSGAPRRRPIASPRTSLYTGLFGVRDLLRRGTRCSTGRVRTRPEGDTLVQHPGMVRRRSSAGRSTFVT
jgi:SAM-dependent methyltransferase